MPLTREFGHLYLEQDNKRAIMYNQKELVKIFRNYSDPASDNLLNLLKLARSWEFDANTKNIG